MVENPIRTIAGKDVLDRLAAKHARHFADPTEKTT